MSTWAIAALAAIVACLVTRLLSRPRVSGWYDLDDMGWSDHGFLVTLTDGRREFFTGATKIAFDEVTSCFVLFRQVGASRDDKDIAEVTRFHEHRVVSFKILTD